MSELIGIKKLSDFQLNPSFKKDALIFNRIAISSVSDFRRMILEGFIGKEFRYQSQEFTWLLKNGIVFQPEFTPQQRQAFISDNHLDSIQQVRAEHKELPTKLSLDFDTYFWNWWDTLCDYETRSLAVMLRVGQNLDAYPISSLTYSKGIETKSEVVTVIINNLPMPSESTPWEQIIEYRSDPDSQSKFLALRNWITDVSRQNLTPVEVEQKLEYLIDQYRQHMELHKMKSNAGVLETIIVSAAEAFEDLVKFKWGRLATSLFSFRQRKVVLLEGELNARGREIAYLLKTSNEFE